MTTTRPDLKTCPFCAEEIKADAIKCRFCGEMLDGHQAALHRATYETRAFVVPFPEDSPPTRHAFDPGSDKPFPDDYLRSIGALNRKTGEWIRRSFKGGVSYTWDAYKDYFLDRINEFGNEGWELAEPFEHPVDANGWLARPGDRFDFEPVTVQGFFGPAQKTRLAGAKFLMRRVKV